MKGPFLPYKTDLERSTLKRSLIKLLDFKSEKVLKALGKKDRIRKIRLPVGLNWQHTKKGTRGTAFLMQAKDFIFQPSLINSNFTYSGEGDDISVISFYIFDLFLCLRLFNSEVL